jgi:CDP-glycerol glycerophosphotransferase (TagB/SpsB family)
VDETGLLGKVVGLVGKKAQVPTLNVQHGIRTDSPWIEDQFFDRFAVFGPQTAEVFVARGADPNIFVPVGVPRYDCLFRKQNLKSREAVAEELGFNPDRPVLLFASQRAWGRMTPSVKRETLLTLLRAWHRTDAELIIKLRDGQDDYIPAEAMKEIGWDRVIVTSEYNLYDLLNAVDIVTTAYSTVGLEAIALGKPLFIINLTGQPDPIPFVAEGVAVGSYNPEDVTLKLHHLLDKRPGLQEWERKRTDFIRRFMTNGDGASTERLVHLIYQMLDICR